MTVRNVYHFIQKDLLCIPPKITITHTNTHHLLLFHFLSDLRIFSATCRDRRQTKKITAKAYVHTFSPLLFVIVYFMLIAVTNNETQAA
jgi:hypothetical protein